MSTNKLFCEKCGHEMKMIANTSYQKLDNPPHQRKINQYSWECTNCKTTKTTFIFDYISQEEENLSNLEYEAMTKLYRLQSSIIHNYSMIHLSHNVNTDIKAFLDWYYQERKKIVALT